MVIVDPDPAFYLNADPDPGSQTNARSMQILIWIMVILCRHKKMDFDIKNILYVVICHKKYLSRYKRHFKKAGRSGLFVIFGQFPCSRIWIRIPNTDRGPGEPPVPEIIDTVFAKTSPKRSFPMTEYERFGLVFSKCGSINSGTGFWKAIQT